MMLEPDPEMGELDIPDIAEFPEAFEVMRLWVLPQVDECAGCGETHASIMEGVFAPQANTQTWGATLGSAVREVAKNIAEHTGRPVEMVASEIEFHLHASLTAHSEIAGVGHA